jgi:hypothetical protein
MKLLDLAALNHFTVSIAMLLFSRDRWARSLRSTPPLGKPSVLASFDYFGPALLNPIAISLRRTEPIVDAKKCVDLLAIRGTAAAHVHHDDDRIVHSPLQSHCWTCNEIRILPFRITSSYG